MDPPPGWRIVADDRTSRLIENSHAIPRVFVPRRIRFIDSDDTTLKEMAVATDFAEEAWVRARRPAADDRKRRSDAARATQRIALRHRRRRAHRLPHRHQRSRLARLARLPSTAAA